MPLQNRALVTRLPCVNNNFGDSRFGSWQREEVVDQPQKPSQTAAAAAGAAAYLTPAPEEASGRLTVDPETIYLRS